jgi:hypothetical protein
MAAAAVVIAAVVVAAVAAGWDVAGWLGEVWTSLTSVSLLFLVPALALQTLQTGFAAMAWYGILRFAYPQSEVRYLGVRLLPERSPLLMLGLRCHASMRS